jgi:hypothetical protein
VSPTCGKEIRVHRTDRTPSYISGLTELLLMALYSTKSGKKVQQNKFKQLTLIDSLVFSANFSNNISAVF